MAIPEKHVAHVNLLIAYLYEKHAPIQKLHIKRPVLLSRNLELTSLNCDVEHERWRRSKIR